MKIVITTFADRTWPKHQVDIQTDEGVVVAYGRSQNYPGSTNATVQKAAEAAISLMEDQLKQAREHLIANGLLKGKK